MKHGFIPIYMYKFACQNARSESTLIFRYYLQYNGVFLNFTYS